MLALRPALFLDATDQCQTLHVVASNQTGVRVDSWGHGGGWMLALRPALFLDITDQCCRRYMSSHGTGVYMGGEINKQVPVG
jgi:hypothetical protein